jgi:hypothetical protein
MKIVISESQYNRLIEAEEEQKVLNIPSLKFFNDDWFQLQEFLETKGNPPYSISGDLNLYNTPIKSLGNLISVGGNLRLAYTPIESLGNLQSVGGYLSLQGTPIESLGNLQSVGEFLDLESTPIKSFGNLQSVGGSLDLQRTPLSYMYTQEQIRQMVNVEVYIYL